MSPIGDLARQDGYDLPDVGPPLLPGGPQFSPGLPAVNQAMGSLLAPRRPVPASPVAFRTASPLVNITEQDIANAQAYSGIFGGGGRKVVHPIFDRMQALSSIPRRFGQHALGALAAQDNYQQ
jgi:hypothetical protein